ncbi:TonB-dependent receptor [Candidatus Nitrosacidococcus tergens]|uniref:Putative TonB-dependent receptor n=1 Tax=Candidatus Nitrosacidococcus tergens TaxID=553981 RepID=A0A7G1QCG2_9GAMM|nr:TonB-dependent siderophore receptor [Candidatus Nitrosacidococcus tergens]CAB1277380.1 putative TonB-dependent receptor [Candidatus Nitrosacidococcus tergens]
MKNTNIFSSQLKIPNSIILLTFLSSISFAQGAEKIKEEKSEETKKLDPIQVQSAKGESTYFLPNTSSAMRTDTPLKDTPQSVYVLPKELLRDQNVQSIGDAMRNVPGVTVNLGEGNRDEVVIRGIDTKFDFFVNGLRDDSEYFRDPYNIEHLDVLKGSSGMIFGRGNGGGVVNLVTKQPTLTPHYSINLNGGYWDHKRATVDFGGPIPGDVASYRLNAMVEDSGGFRDFFYLHRYGVDPEVTFQIDPNTKLTIGGQHLNDNRLADRGIASQNGRPADVPIETFFGSPTQNFSYQNVEEAHGIFEHTFDDSLKIQNSFRFIQTVHNYQNLYPGSAVSSAGTVDLSGYHHDNTRDNFFNRTDIIYKVDTGSIHQEIMSGLVVSHEEDSDLKIDANKITGVSILDPVGVGVFDKVSRNRHVTGTDIGVYLQDQIAFNEHWKLVAGARYDWFKVVGDDFLGGPHTERVDNTFSPRAGLIYEPTSFASFYASYAKTYTPQGANLALSLKDASNAALAPLVSTNYEIGTKFVILKDKLSVNSAFFRLDLDNVNSPDPNDPSILVQLGSQRNEGFEVSATGEIFPGLQIVGGYTRLSAHLLTATTSGNAGATVGLVPQDQFNFWSTYAFTPHVGMSAGVNAQSSMYTSFSDKVLLPGYVLPRAMIYYTDLNYRISLNFDNISNTVYYPTAAGDNQIMPGAPFNVMANFTATF